MNDQRAAIYTALQNDSTLTAIIADRVYFHYSKSNASYPQITYFKVDDLGVYSFGNTEDISNLYYQIDAWDNSPGGSNLLAMESAIDDVMNGLGFQRTYAFDEYDEDTNVYRLVTRYEGLF